ncbi:penicillin-binding protein [Pontibacter qinzhouensis]|uniref:Penicillin-binding protein n=1 Tax=Pontibacter qinzhouensis TaxID=2603253 RepID=A0A5C8K896_9BACT|nr:transglycosylase domain-containing protein [Pontibacter qinzhouensis]TXK47929.1 penicillin-binding protein [Pontibacter qinzhouensis]
MLRKILNFILLGLLLPVLRFFKNEFSAFYKSQKPKVTAGYWKQKWTSVRNFNWRSAKPSSFLFLFRWAYKLGLVVLLFAFVFYMAVYMGALGHIPSRKQLKAIQNSTASEIYSADKVLLGRYYLQDRTNVRYDNIAPAAIDALVATEDARFYEHSGIDTRSLGRVLVKTLLMQHESSGGGSTLSQQLAKNLYPRKNYLVWDMAVNKIREMIIARKLESVYSKQELLELYLNTVPMGGNLYGIERASRRFFNTSADSLKTEEAAVLIGMLKATTSYNPRLDLERSRKRRNVVLNQMAKYQFLPQHQADSLKQLPLKLNYRYETHNDGMAPYFRELLRQELVQWCASQKKPNGDPYNLYTDGLKIYTTLDAGMQKHAERSVRQRMAQLQKQFDAHWQGRLPWGNDASVLTTALHRSDRYKKMKAAGKSEEEIRDVFREPVPLNVFSWNGITKKTMSPLDSIRHHQKFLNTGLLAMEPHTGYIRAWVGGIDHHIFKYDHVRSRRQVGSTFKPIVYAAALEQGIAPCKFFPNERQTYPEHEDWSPRNANEVYGGEYSMRGALANSVNTVSAQLIMQTGVDQTIGLARRMGIRNDLPAVPSLALGTANLSLLEMVSAYASFASDGYQVTPVYIEQITDRSGKVIRQHKQPGSTRALSRTNAAIMLQLMQGVVEEGSAVRLRTEFGLKMDIAGKTGTTQEQADGWFIGITPNLVTGVWVGAESPKVRFRTLELGQGSRTALPIWGEFTKRVAQDPAYVGYYNSRFQPLPAALQARLACESFRETPPEQNFIERVFDSITDRVNQTYDDWKNQRKTRREEKKRERQEKRKKKN